MSTQHTNSIDVIQTARPDAETSFAATPSWLPGLICVVLYWLVMQSVERFSESNFLIFMTTFIGPLVTALLFFITWLGFSRRPWSERGLGTVIEANPKSHVELARIPAMEGKTWNHPAVVRDQLFVRNGEQIASFKLTLRSDGITP